MRVPAAEELLTLRPRELERRLRAAGLTQSQAKREVSKINRELLKRTRGQHGLV